MVYPRRNLSEMNNLADRDFTTPTTPSAAQILEERISDAALSTKKNSAARKLLIELCFIAVPAVLQAGAAGNVTCRIAARKILTLLK